jgi:hypothetical protein
VEKNCHQYFILCGSTSITFFDKYTDREPSREEYRHLQTLLTHFPPCSGSHGLPSLPCEGDYDQKWSDLGSVARFFSFSLLIFLFFLLLALRSNVSEPPPPPLSSPTFCFTSFSSDRVSYGWLEPSTDSLSFVGTTFPFQWATRSSTAVDVWWASGLGTSSSSRFC